jgi:hypothetical protein
MLSEAKHPSPELRMLRFAQHDRVRGMMAALHTRLVG